MCPWLRSTDCRRAPLATLEMGSSDRSKQKIQLWKKALVHFALCFVTGFFTGFAPSSTATVFSASPAASERHTAKGIGELTAAPVTASAHVLPLAGEAANRSLVDIYRSAPVDGDDPPPQPPLDLRVSEAALTTSRRLLIIVTTTRSGDQFEGPFLRRLGHTLRLVSPPLLWIVVQAHADAPATAAMLRTTGVMYRHLTFKENFTDPAAEADHQRNVALSHVEYHRLTGIVHFAGKTSVYDLRFFEEIRDIEVFGTWPVAMLSTNKKRVVVDGPICNSSKVQGWILKDLNNDKRLLVSSIEMRPKPPKINISGFAFNSAILWDPERWGRSTSLPDTSQDSIKFVQEVILEDETKLKGIPPDCSSIMVWHVHVPRIAPLPTH